MGRDRSGMQNRSYKEMSRERLSVCTARWVNPWQVLQLPFCSSRLKSLQDRVIALGAHVSSSPETGDGLT